MQLVPFSFIHMLRVLRYRRVNSLVTLLFILVSLVKLHAQDPHFSQFYASPLTLNPAIAGTYNGTFRISTLYRDQWRSAIDTPLRTFAMSGDVKFDVKYGANNLPDAVGIGITFFGDRVTSFDYNTNQILLTAAYHKVIDKRTKQYLGIGVQGGVFQKSISYEDLTFQDQFNAVDGYTLETGEFLPPNNKSFTDLSIGLHYSITPTKKINFHAGLGYFHINQPNLSFFNTPDIIGAEINKTDILHAKWSAYAGASFRTGDRMTLQPRVNALSQGPYSEVNLGATFRYKLSRTAGQYLLFGPYARGAKGIQGTRMEALILMTGIEMNNFIIGMSYDQNLSRLLNSRKSLSSFEISFIYIGEYHNEDHFCPQW
ncbi:MAG: PorP/SprF family type IX secretion system membrane protein [Saprospiraceae bacterium]|jgi:type IX secretion system PorP/SprF family membrane protein|nr:PorP/SprF family type IX secretion system membrane protein [Saprospiraceae bacterium]